MPEGEYRDHTPVLLEAVVELLSPSDQDRLLDLTVGPGGHAAALLARLGPEGRLVAVDRDPASLALARERLADPRVEVLEGNFGEPGALRAVLPCPAYEGVLLDLGVSSLQLDTPDRGFSFRADAPLDMRMNPAAGESAAELIARLGESELQKIIAEYGEERHARRVARAIIRERERAPIESTGQLAELVRAQVPAAGRGRIDAATRTFQALRIAVNGELDALDRFLASIDLFLAPGGRLAVIAYHSLEDRRVKQVFRRHAREGDELLTPRPIRPDADEERRNPRSRSARLRGLKKPEREGSR